MSNPEKTVPKGIEEQALAERYGVEARTIRRWRSAGVDVEDEAAVKAFRATQQRTEALSLREAKLVEETRLKKAQAERAELLLAQTRGELISIPELEETLLALGSRTRAALSRLEKELPPSLEGLDARAMAALIQGKIEAVLFELCEEFGALTKPQGSE